MNPFYFSGPAFLFFYIIFGFVVLVAKYFWFDLIEGNGKGDIREVMTDPYKIAYLRSGDIGAVEVAVFSLIDRKLLLSNLNEVQINKTVSTKSVNRPIEKALLEFFKTNAPWREALQSKEVQSACATYHHELEVLGLLKNKPTIKKQVIITNLTIAVFISVSAIKMNIAISNNSHKLLFLFLLTIVFIVINLLIGRQRLTKEGLKAMYCFEELFSGLQQRANKLVTGGQTNETALLAAVFGLKSISESKFPFVVYFKPNPKAGSSCSSCSSGSSCGGGGGCGGGCGGCGGCSG